jgi:ferrous-iron efflux pump FieF
MAVIDKEQNDAESASKRRVAGLSVFVAAFLIILKSATAWKTGSVSVLASLLDSLMDIFASIINFLAVQKASQPADEDHPYGHGKAESLAGLFQSVVITISGLFLIWEAVNRLRTAHETESPVLGIVTMVVAIGVSVALVTRLRKVSRETDSQALAADALHYQSDIYINAGVLVALAITALTGWAIVDPIISILIAIYILWSALSVGHESVDMLMDRDLPAETGKIVAEIVGKYRQDGVIGFHNLRTRRSGSERFVDFHLEVDRKKPFEEAHDLTVKVLREIESAIPRTSVHVHTDPADN